MAKYKIKNNIPADEVMATMRAIERYANTAEYISAGIILAILGIEEVEEEKDYEK